MDRQIINWNERYYKVVATVLVIIITVILVYWSHTTAYNPNIVFYASIIYALVLFLIGNYMSTTSSEINYHLTERADIYRKLKKISERMELMNVISKETNYIKAFQELSGRSEKLTSKRKEMGDDDFYYTYDIVPLSDAMSKKIGTLETNYINKELEVQKNNERLGTLDKSTKEYKKAEFKQKIKIKAHQCNYKKIKRKYKKIERIVNSNIKHIRNIYGIRIEYEANRLQEVQDSLWDINNVLDEKHQETINKLDEIMSILSSLKDQSDDNSEGIEAIQDSFSQIETMQQENRTIINQVRHQLSSIQESKTQT